MHRGYPISSHLLHDRGVNEIRHTPIVGEDYPRTWGQFEEWFASEDDCLRYLERLRGRDGFVCPRCGYTHEPYRANRARLICRSCRLQCTVTSGTILDKTRTPLKVWLAAAWYITSQKSGVSAWACNGYWGWAVTRQPGPCCTVFRRAISMRCKRIRPKPFGSRISTAMTMSVLVVYPSRPALGGLSRRSRIARSQRCPSAAHVPAEPEIVELNG
jgi:hypothetical protein